MDNIPFTKKDADNLVKEYWKYDGHQFPDWMAIGKGDNEVRYDYDSSKICYSLIRLLQPTNCLEFGTSFGHSALFSIDALLKNGKAFNWLGYEMEKDLFDKTQSNLEKRFGDRTPDGNKFIHLYNADITECLDDIPDDLDFVFIDTNHETKSTDWYVKNVFPKIKKGGLVAIHDLAWYTEDNLVKSKHHLGAASHELEESKYLRDLYNEGKLPLEKIYWLYEDREEYESRWEGTFWLKK